jgi:hypothetical protein
MGKGKKAAGNEEDITMRELMARHGLDPADELFSLLNHTVEYPDTGDPERDIRWMENLKESYEPFIDERGRMRLKLKMSKRIEILKELLSYSRPKLKGTEIRGTVDHTFNINIQTFDDYGSKKVVDITQPIPQLNDANRESNESIPDGTVNGSVP